MHANYQAAEDLLHDRIVLLTGAGDGIGRAMAMAYARHGATVVLLGKTVAKLEQVYDEIEAAVEEVLDDGSWSLELKMPEKDLRRFLKRENLAEDQLVPEPMEKWAVCAASPSKTTFPWCQRLQVRRGKLSHSEPRRWRAAMALYRRESPKRSIRCSRPSTVSIRRSTG